LLSKWVVPEVNSGITPKRTKQYSNFDDIPLYKILVEIRKMTNN
jgi:hypothetical protein